MSDLSLKCVGDGSRTIVWIHGYTMDCSVWEPLWSRLPEYRHVGVDLPRHGGSAASPFSNLAAIADSVLSIAGRYGARDLVAMSFGGIIALEAAIRAAPASLTSLVLASPAVGGAPLDPQSTTCNIDLIRMATERGLGPWLCDRWMSVPPRIFEGASRRPEIFEALRSIVMRHSFRELATGEMRTVLQHRQLPDLPKIDVPTLLLLGEDDMDSFKRGGELLRRGIPKTERRYVPDAGHLCLLERPDEGAAHIREFLLAHRAE